MGEMVVGNRLQILSGSARDNRLSKTVTQTRNEGYERMEPVSVEFRLWEDNKENVFNQRE